MADTDTEELPANSPSTPPSITSTCEPADQTAAASGAGTPTMDGWRSSDQIRALCDAATPGPWSFYLGDLWAGATADELATADRLSAEHVFSDEAEDIFERASHLFHGDPVRPEDAAFIAAARELVPQLLAEVAAAHRFEQSAAAERDALLAEVEKLHKLRAELTEFATTLSRPEGIDSVMTCGQVAGILRAFAAVVDR